MYTESRRSGRRAEDKGLDETQQGQIEALQHKVTVLNRLVEVSLVMNSTLQLQPLLRYIMDAAAEITGAEAASILLVDEKTQDLRFTASTGGDSGGLTGIIVPMDGSIAGLIVSENRPLIIDDAANDPRHFRHVDQQVAFQTRSILGVPMRIKDKLIGVLEVLNKKEGGFNEDDVLHIAGLSAQAAVSIENARLVEELQSAYTDLSKLDKLKSDFIAIASHELRTPLALILGYASFLQEDTQGESLDHVNKVLESGLHLSNLIESLTNLRFMDTQEAKLHRSTMPLEEVLESAHKAVARLAESKEQTLTVELPDKPVSIFADRPTLRMTLINVLNNAIKFTEPGGKITVTVQQRPKEAWISVKDNGLGLAANQVEHIFDRFYQVEDHLTRKQGGLGLGLSIAREFIEQQEGRIWAESPGEGKGTTVIVAIPLAEGGA